MVLLIGGFVIVLLLAVLVGAGVILWNRLSSISTTASHAPPPIVQQDAPPLPPPSPIAARPPDPDGMANALTPGAGPTTRPASESGRPVVKAMPTPAPAPTDTSAEEWLLKELRNPDRAARKRAAAILQLRGWEPTNDEQAALVLVAMDNPLAAERYGDAAVEALCLPLSDGGSGSLSVASAESLGHLLDARAVQPLCTALRASSDAEARAAAATALGRIRDPAGIPALEQSLATESDDATKKCIADALKKVMESKGSDRLVAALQDDEPKAQLRAAILLARKDDPHAIEWLEQAINVDDAVLRGRAIDLLRQIASPGAIQALVRRAAGKGFDGPAEAVDALAEIGQPAVPAMIDALPKAEPNGQRALLSGLARIGPPAMPALTKALTGASNDLKQTACDALGRLGDRGDVAHKPVEPMIALLADPDTDVRRYAVHALELLHWEPADDAQREQFAKAKGGS